MKPISRVLAVFLILYLGCGVFAAAQNRYIDPQMMTPFEMLRSGQAVIVGPFCYDVNPRYEELTQKLDTLKNSIRKDANCTDQAVKLEDFSAIVENTRPQFLSLIQKSATAALNPDEKNLLKGYLEKVTTAGGNLTELAAGSSCFDDDKKNDLSIEVIASVVQEASAVVGSLSGPAGAMIGVGGQITANLMVGIDKIVRSRRAYDFSDADQRKVFIKTMCSYTSFWDKFDRISHADEWIKRLSDFREVRTKQIEGVGKNCSECRQIALEYQKEYNSGNNWVFEPPKVLAERFRPLVDAADKRFTIAYGSATVGGLSDIAWSNRSIVDIQMSLNDMGDVERDRMVEMQETIENFFFVKWMPEFLEYQQNQVRLRYMSLRSYLYETAGRLLVRPAGRSRIAALDELWPILFKAKPDTQNLFISRREREAYIASAQREASSRLSQMISAQLAVERQCMFVRAARMQYHRGLHRVCDEDQREFTEQLYKELYLLFTRSMPDSAVVRSVFEVASPGMLDWAERNGVKLPNPEIRWMPTWIEAMVQQGREIDAADPQYYILR